MEQSPSGCGLSCKGCTVPDLGPWSHSSLLCTPSSLDVGMSGTSESCQLGPWTPTADLQQEPATKRVDVESFKLVQPLPGSKPRGKKAKAGRDEVKIQERWEGLGKCTTKGCKHMRETGFPCHRQVPLATLVTVSSALWSITAEQRELTFSTLYADAVGASKANECPDEEQPRLLQQPHHI